MQDYDFTLIYEPGTGNIADGLSRLRITEVPPTQVNFVEEHVHVVKKDNALPSIEEIQEAGKKDSEMQSIIIAVQGMPACKTDVKLNMMMSKRDGTALMKT